MRKKEASSGTFFVDEVFTVNVVEDPDTESTPENGKIVKVKRPKVSQFKFECTECAYNTKIEKDFALHTQAHANGDSVQLFKCANCSYLSCQKSTFAIHQIYCNLHRSVPCPLCRYYAKRYGKLNKHILKAHKDTLMFKCERCKFTTTSWLTASKHKKHHLERGITFEKNESPEKKGTNSKT